MSPPDPEVRLAFLEVRLAHEVLAALSAVASQRVHAADDVHGRQRRVVVRALDALRPCVRCDQVVVEWPLAFVVLGYLHAIVDVGSGCLDKNESRMHTHNVR